MGRSKRQRKQRDSNHFGKSANSHDKRFERKACGAFHYKLESVPKLAESHERGYSRRSARGDQGDGGIRNSGLWTLGTNSGNWYPLAAGTLYDSFGETAQYSEGQPSQDITQFHVYEASSQAGLWESWIDGVPLYESKSNTVAFSTAPLLGKNGYNGYFGGDIAEIVIYNRVLSASERQGLLTYFAQKYALLSAPAAPADLSAIALSSTANLISWDWQENNSQISFVIERKTGSGGTYSAPATVNGTGTYQDNSVASGQIYYYRAYAVNAGGASSYSDETGVATPMPEGGSVSISGMKLWLMADGAWESPVGYLADYSGNGNDAWQNTYASKPTLTANALNGKPVVHFTTSSSQFLNLPNLMSGATAGEVLVVLRATAASGTDSGLWTLGTNSGNWYPLAAGTLYDSFGENTQYSEGQPSQDITQFHVYEASSQAGLWESWIDGVPLYESKSNTVAFSTAPLLGKNGYNGYFAGDIAEIVIYNRVLSASERDGLLTYFTQKYALLSTPATPTGLQTLALNSTTAFVTWNAPATNSVTSYNVWRQQDAGAWTLVATVPGTRTFVDTGLMTSSNYSYEVQTVTSGGSSALTATVTLDKSLVSVNSLPTSGMKLWLMADGAWESPVGYLADYSGNGNDAWQNTYANRPTLTANAVNGKPVVHFTASSSQFLTLPNFMSGATAGEVLVVIRATATSGTNSGLWTLGTNSGNWYPLADGTLYNSFGETAQYSEGQPAQNITQFHVYEACSQAGLWQSWIDGVSLYQSNSNTVAFSAAPLLGKNGYNGYFAGDMAEIVIYNRALTPQERESWLQYFAIKYLIGNLDPDGDGLTTAQELALGLNPLNAYTNAASVIDDGTAIALGLNPLNPLTFYPNPNGPPSPSTPPPSPGVPVITLTSPAGAVLH